MKTIALSEVSPERRVLTGLLGRRIYPRLIERLVKQEHPQPLFLNFEGMIATGSFFSQAILPLRDYCISQRFNLYPVVSNIDEETEEELKLLFEMSPDAVFVCRFNNKGEISDSRWIGILEEKQQITFDAVLKEGETNAITLAEKYKEEKISPTGWNNRLSSLVAKGLIREIKKGRGKSYIPVFETKGHKSNLEY